MSDAFSRFSEVDALLAQALEVAVEKRRSFLEEACRGDAELRDLALRLLVRADEDEVLESRDNLALVAARAAALAEDDSDRQAVGALVVGGHFGDYLVLSPVGAGGMGEVYRARDERLGREVALKVLPSEFARDSDRLARLEREARLLATLNHPHINTIHELEEADGRKALVLELVEGETLAQRLTEGPLPVAESLAVARQIAAALVAAHGQGVLHRDLKPANIKVTPQGQVKVLDFGLAKATRAVGDDQDLTHAGDPSQTNQPLRIAGTGPYMSPEQWRGAAADERSDIWAFGCILFEMLAGARAFAGDTATDTAVAVVEHQPDWQALPRATPRSLRKLLRRCLEKDPENRMASAEAVQESLDRCAGESASGFPFAMGTRRMAAILVAMVLLALLTWIATSFLPNRPLPAGSIDSIAVLPFENASDDPENEYLSVGLTDSLINSLSKLPDLRVVPRGIVNRYQAGEVVLETVAEELDVRALVTGRVSERDGKVVIGAELTDAVERSQLWGRQYTHSADDLLALQDDLVRSILAELRLELTPGQRRRGLDPATDNPAAFRLYLRAKYYTLRMTPEGLDKGLDYARQAVELDPAFALAYVVLSHSHTARAFLGLDPWEAAGLKSRAAVRRAIELDGSLGAAHIEVGYLRHHFDWDWAGAERAFRRAIELDPDHAEAHQGLSETLLSLRLVDEAVAVAERAVELDPFDPSVHHWLAHCYLGAGRYADAERANLEALELEPTHLLARSTHPLFLFLNDREEEAIDELRETLTAMGRDSGRSSLLATFYAWRGEDTRAREILAWFGPEALDQLAPYAQAEVALALGLLGDTEQAFDILEGMLAERSRGLLWIQTRPLWKPLYDEPRFQSIVRRMGLPPP